MKKLNEWLLRHETEKLKKAKQKEISKVENGRLRYLLAPSDESVKVEALENIADFHLKEAKDLWPLAKHGGKFADNKRGLSALYREVFKIFELNGATSSAKDVWELLRSQGNRDVIQEVTDDEIFWRDDNGHEKSTKRTSFNNQLSEIRKKLKQ